MTQNERIKKFIIWTFLAVPILSSLISTYHLIDLFNLGNLSFISIVLAVTFEIGSVAAFVVPFVFKKIDKTLIYSVFALLVFVQILGNIYSTFNYINIQLVLDANWLSSIRELFAYFIGNDNALIKITVASIISIPIPLISLFFLKSLIDYIDLNKVDNLKIEDKENIYNKTNINSAGDTLEQDTIVIPNDEKKLEDEGLNKEETEVVDNFQERFLNSQEEIDPEIQEEVNKGFWEMIEPVEAEDEKIKTVEKIEMNPAILANNNLK